MKQVDYIIAGAGCAGRSLAVRLLPHLKASGKKLLLIDQEPKTKNDRTWCFWEKNEGFFDSIVFHKWNSIKIYSQSAQLECEIAPYQYKMIRALDFYELTDQILEQNTQIERLYAKVEDIYQKDGKAFVVCNGIVYACNHLFSSIPKQQEKQPERYQYLLQHFEGWTIETTASIFDVGSATLMDFRTSQHPGTAFVYVLPLHPNRALVEYTVFSEKLLSEPEYETALKKYIAEQLQCNEYTIIDRETGIIPMSDHPISSRNGAITYLGTAGGYTKASTGYTFQFIQKQAETLVEQLVKTGNIKTNLKRARRFNWYDGTLLFLLNKGKLSGAKIFYTLFKKNKAQVIFKFLDNETSVLQEAKIFSTLQKRTFAHAFLSRMFKLLS